MSILSQAVYPFESWNWRPKYHTSRSPMVRHTRSNSSCPLAFTFRLNSSSASIVDTFTGNDLTGFFFLNMLAST